jgi:uncharacterized protein YjbJ (UPF0337 family)
LSGTNHYSCHYLRLGNSDAVEAEGNADKTVGKVQNAVGGLKDAVRGK